MTYNPARDRLAKGELSLGVGLRLVRTGEIAKIMQAAGFDWLWIDLEHGPHSLDQASQISLAAIDAGITPLVRVPEGQFDMATRALDGGAWGIVMPHVDTAEEAREVVDRLKYPPLGHRSSGGLLPHFGYKPMRGGDAARLVNEHILLTVMVETPKGVANADAIAAVPGVDVRADRHRRPDARARHLRRVRRPARHLGIRDGDRRLRQARQMAGHGRGRQRRLHEALHRHGHAHDPGRRRPQFPAGRRHPPRPDLARNAQDRRNAMTTATTTFAVEDIEYLRHGAKPLLLRLFRPAGRGPFPAVVELHGGAWHSGDRTVEATRHEALAERGIVVASLDFRHGVEGAYPLGVADINYAIRWVKTHAKDLSARGDAVAISGQSSGGHLAMLAAMRPSDPRYTAIPLAGADASVRCVVMSWPVINPLSRYRHAKRAQAGGAAWANDLIAGHDEFWRTEANMADGSPIVMLERGEKVQTPPALWIQAPNDNNHDYRDPEGGFDGNEPQRFVDRYRKAGGQIDLVYYDAPLRFTSVAPKSPAAIAAFDRIAQFIKQHLA